MFILILVDARDRIFNRGSYKNCRFINNTASNIAGLSLVTADSYRTQLSHAPVEIIDWYVLVIIAASLNQALI